MFSKISRKLFFQTITVYLAAILIWTLLFSRNPFLKDVLLEIHIIFSSTILSYLIIRMLFSQSMMDFIKVFIRTLFRVWLLIFITFAISKSMERIGILLSLTFIFGYIEGLLDINKWLESDHPFVRLFTKGFSSNKLSYAFTTILLMSIIHIFCAIALFVFYLFL